MKSIITPILAAALLGLLAIALFQGYPGWFDRSSNASSRSDEPAATTPVVVLQSASEFETIISESSVPVLFDFYASWCGPCVAQGQVLEEMGLAEDQARVVKIDVDRHPDLAAQFNVTSIPTLVVFEDGQKTYQKKGLHGEKDIYKALKLN